MAEAAVGRADSGPSRSVRWIVVLALTAFVVSIGTPLIGVRVFHGADMLLDRAPWRVTPPTVTVATNPIVGDTVSTFMPLHAEVRRRFFDGDFPVWTSLPGGGHPLASVTDAGALGLLNLPYLLVPLSYAPGLAKLLELAVAMGFTFLFLRRLGLGRTPALFGGLVFAYSGFQVVWTNWPQSHVGALIPALFWAVERALQERRSIDATPVALATMAMLLEGFPSVTGYAVLAAGAYAVVRIAVTRTVTVPHRLLTLGVVAGGLALGFGLAAFQLLPLADRAAELDLGYRVQPPDWHIPPSALATLAIPDVFGTPPADNYWGPLNYVEIQSFIGATSLVAVTAAAAWRLPGAMARGATAFLWASAGVAGVLLFVGAPVLGLAQTSDLFGLNFVGRLRALLGFLLAALAALGMHAMMRAPASAGRTRARTIAAWTGAVLVAAIGLRRLERLADSADRGEQMASASILPVAAAGLAALVVAASRSRRWRGMRPAAWVLPGIFVVEALVFAIPYWPRIDPDAFYPTTAAHRQVERRVGSDRLLGAGGAMFPGTTTMYGLRSLTTNNTLPQLPSWEDLIRAVDRSAFDQSPVFPSMAPTHAVATSPVLDRMSVRFVMAPPNVPVFGDRVALVPQGTGSAPIVAGGQVTRRLDGTGPWRAVLVPLSERLSVPPGSRLIAEVRDTRGRTVARGVQPVFAGDGPGFAQVLLPEATCGVACVPPLSIQLSLVAESGRLEVVAGTDGAPALSMVEAVDDGLRLEITANVAGYRRLGVLPRIRWAARAETVLDPDRRVAMIEQGLAPDLVLLSRAGPRAEGLPADLSVVRDTGDEIRVNVDAAGGGYLVVADPIQHGWEATINGRATPLRQADHALAAVYVPPGLHEIELRFGSPSWWAGVWISVGSILAILSVVVASALRRQRTRLADTDGRG